MNSILFGERRIYPSKIVCVGRNYVAHIEELGNEIGDEMVVFFKPNSAISETLHACHGEALHYEGELAFVYEAGSFSAVGFGLDLTRRELQSRLKQKGLPWERAKAFDGAAVFSPFVALSQAIGSLSMSLEINDVLVQSGGVELMIYKPEQILRELAEFVTLSDGDIVMTGTPKGVGRIEKGDRFTGSVYAKGELLTSATWTAK